MKNFYICFILLLSVSCGADSAELLLKSSESWDKKAIAYPQGTAEITALRLTLKAGESTPFHCHPVPTFGHMTKGQLEVETINGNKKTMNAGDTVIEVMNTIHRGTAVEDVEIMVYYAGAKGVPHTVIADADDAPQYCSD